jgi:MerR family mercuric resistance operon transcriptional regulator
MDMTIGKLAKAAGVGVETIRFYERKGILKRPAKKEGGFRYYPMDEASRIRFVRRAQELGFTLKEVKELLDIQSKRKLTGKQVEQKAKEKIQEIKEKISDLKQMEDSLEKLAQICGRGTQAIQECKIFDCFEKGC